MNRIQELESQIKKFREIYYGASAEVQEKEGISDAEYDLLELELRELDPYNPLLEVVGSSLEENRAKLSFPMLSQEKALTEEESLNCLNRFDEETQVILTEKLDGAGLDLTYENGNLVSAITRGDWQSGTEVLFAAKLIPSIPKSLYIKDKFHVRGEVVIYKKDFILVNKERERRGEKAFANARNLAAGSVKLVEKEEILNRRMNFVAYDIFADTNFFSLSLGPHKTPKYSLRLLLLKNLGFTIPQTHINYSVSLKKTIVSTAYSLLESPKYPYDVDGIVVREDDIELSESMGLTTHHWKMSFAIKPKPESVWVEIDHIDWTMSRKGTLTPTAVFNPVLLSGAMIGRAQLFNLNNVERLNACKGTKVRVVRSGLVIPKIVQSDFHMQSVDFHSEEEKQQILKDLSEKKVTIREVGSSSIKFYFKDLWQSEIPDRDPLTGAELEMVYLSEEGARVLRAKNKNSNYKTIAKKIEFFLKSIRVLGWGEVLLEEYCLNSGVQTVSEFIKTLTIEKVQTCIKSRSISSDYASDLVLAVSSKKTVEAVPFLKGLGIARVQESAKDLIDKMTSKNDLLDLSIYEKVLTPGVYSYAKYDIELNGSEYKEIIGLYNIVFSKKEKESDVLKGLSFVITGTLSKQRSYFKELIESNGGKVMSAVSAKTNYLLAGKDCGSKLAAAEKLGVKILTESAFLDLLNK